MFAMPLSLTSTLCPMCLSQMRSTISSTEVPGRTEAQGGHQWSMCSRLNLAHGSSISFGRGCVPFLRLFSFQLPIADGAFPLVSDLHGERVARGKRAHEVEGRIHTQANAKEMPIRRRIWYPHPTYLQNRRQYFRPDWRVFVR